MSLPVKKVYIDSRFRTPDSLSTSSFKFQLSRNLYMPKNTVFYVEDVCIPNTWLTIETGVNDRLYVRYAAGQGFYFDVYVTIGMGQYDVSTFATALQSAFTSFNINPTGQSVIHPFQNVITVTPATVYNTVSITSSSLHFFLPTDHDLQTLYNGTWLSAQYAIPYDINNIQSCNMVIGNTTGTSPLYVPGTRFNSSFLQLTHNNIYISSPNLGTYTTLGARGESNIIKKIPVTSSYGYLIVDQYSSNHDFLDCSDQTLCTLEFNIKDVTGNVVNLHGYNVSFSLVFASHNEDGVR